MFNTFQKRQQKTKNKIRNSYLWEFALGLTGALILVFGIPTMTFIFLTNNSQASPEKFSKWSEKINIEMAV